MGDQSVARQYGELLGQLDPNDLKKTGELIRTLRDLADTADLDDDETAAMNLAAFETYADIALRDDIVTGDEDRVLADLRGALGLGYERLLEAGYGQLVDRIEIARINAGRLYEASSTLDPDESRGEWVVWDDVSTLLKQKKRYVGRSSGVSFRIAPGVRFHTGWFEGAQVADRELVEDDHGFFTVTTKRALFRGAARTIQIEYDDIIDMELFSDAIRFHMSNRERVDTFQMVGAPVAAATISKVATMDEAELVERLTGH